MTPTSTERQKPSEPRQWLLLQIGIQLQMHIVNQFIAKFLPNLHKQGFLMAERPLYVFHWPYPDQAISQLKEMLRAKAPPWKGTPEFAIAVCKDLASIASSKHALMNVARPTLRIFLAQEKDVKRFGKEGPREDEFLLGLFLGCMCHQRPGQVQKFVPSERGLPKGKAGGGQAMAKSTPPLAIQQKTFKNEKIKNKPADELPNTSSSASNEHFGQAQHPEAPDPPPIPCSAYQPPGRTTSMDFGSPKLRHKYSPPKALFHLKFPHSEVAKLCAQLDQGQLLPGSAELVVQLQGDQFRNRLDALDEWRFYPATRAQFLRLCVSAVCVAQSDLRVVRTTLLARMLESKMVGEFVDHEILVDLGQQTLSTCPAELATMAEHLALLLCLGFEVLPSKMEALLPRVQALILAIRSANPREHMAELADRLDGLMKAFRAGQGQPSSISASPSPRSSPRKSPKERRHHHQHFFYLDIPPPQDFRLLPCIPAKEDLDAHREEVYLRPVKQKEAYVDDEQYLDVQFRLLREDLIRPLRDGIQQYRLGGVHSTELFIYKGVTLSPPRLNRIFGELLTYATLKEPNGIQWNKRLIYGALVCLSHDHFQSDLLFGTIIDRDRLERCQRVGLKLEQGRPFPVQHGQREKAGQFCMVESPVFFEAYKPVMLALQAIQRGEPLPFSQYLVQAKTEPMLPKYLREDYLTEKHATRWDFSTLLQEKLPHSSAICDVRSMHTRFQPAQLGMDPSQFAALQYALTSELALIQGPPGCGKTFIGLQIVRLMLANERIWTPGEELEGYVDGLEAGGPRGEEEVEARWASKHRPILLVCYTNHALDQFLEGISQFLPDGIIRVGSQCRNEAMDKYKIQNIRHTKTDRISAPIRRRYYDCKQEKSQVRDRLDDCLDRLEQLEGGPSGLWLPHPALLAGAIHSLHSSTMAVGSLREFLSTPPMLAHWLCRARAPEMDIGKLRQLLRFGLPESVARRILYKFGEENVEGEGKSAREMALWWEAKKGNAIVARQLQAKDERIHKHWPSLAQVEALVGLGVHEEVAVQLLCSVEGDFQALIGQMHRQKMKSEGWTRMEQSCRRALGPRGRGRREEETEVEGGEGEGPELDEDGEPLEKPRTRPRLCNSEDWTRREQFGPFLPHILSAEPMPLEKAKKVDNLWALCLPDRWRLHQRWLADAKEAEEAELDTLQKEFCEKSRELMELKELGDVGLMRQAKIVAMTTTGAAMHQSALRALRPRIVVVEEAAEVLEAHLVTSLTAACEQLILIGDHHQLRPKPAVLELANRYGLEISLFERLIGNGYPYRMLKCQHRMRPLISGTLMAHFYEGLEDDDSVRGYPEVRGVQKSLFFLDHDAQEKIEQGTGFASSGGLRSHSNLYEAKFAVRLAQFFFQQGYKREQVTILCAYFEQFLEVRSLVERRFGNADAVRVEVLDAFQGEESDIVILSLVRSLNPEHTVGFLKHKNRACVALSRAKLGLFVLANLEFLAAYCPDIWGPILFSAQKAGLIGRQMPLKCAVHGTVQLVGEVEDFDEKCPEGGCSLACNFRMPCGHCCPRPCHVSDVEHKQAICTQPCQRACREHGTKCERRCDEKCPPCRAHTTVALFCGHPLSGPFCGVPVEELQCQVRCTRELPGCGHPCAELCGAPCSKRCNWSVQRALACGHSARMACHQKAGQMRCQQKVAKLWPICGHRVQLECWMEPGQGECAHPCGQPLADCQHICQGTCGQCRNGRLHPSCSRPCTRVLLCGHPCQSVCSRSCPPCELPCESACAHSRCQLKCGQICVPCNEPCAASACEEHTTQKCAKRCSEPCEELPLCTRPCSKLLACSYGHEEDVANSRSLASTLSGLFLFGGGEKDGKKQTSPPALHRCIGVCGEPCPRLCRICEPGAFEERAAAIFFGDEDNENARFVELTDCGCLLEVNALDHWVAQKLGSMAIEGGRLEGDSRPELVEIMEICCPKCKSPIRRSTRHSRWLARRFEDIQQAKGRIRGNLEGKRLEAEWATLLYRQCRPAFAQIAQKMRRQAPGQRAFGEAEAALKLEGAFAGIGPSELTLQLLATARNIRLLVLELGQCLELINEYTWCPPGVSPPCGEACPQLCAIFLQFGICLRDELGFDSALARDWLKRELLQLFERLELNALQRVSNSFLEQFSHEIGRFRALFDLLKWANWMVHTGSDVGMAQFQLQPMLEIIFSGREFKGEHMGKVRIYMQMLLDMHKVAGLELNQRQLVQIHRALGFDVHRWYKCRNGHIYGIGECGRAMELSVCPECSERIGGERHELAEGSAPAPEMALADPGAPPPGFG